MFLSYLIPLPQRDDQGRKVILSCIAKFDPYKYSSVDMAKIHSIIVESLLDDEENQITGESINLLRIIKFSIDNVRFLLIIQRIKDVRKHFNLKHIFVIILLRKIRFFSSIILGAKTSQKTLMLLNHKCQ